MNFDIVKAMVNEIAPVMREYVAHQLLPFIDRLAELEAHRPERGEKGEPGPAGQNGMDGAAGLDGKDGVGLSSAMIDRDGELVVIMSDGRAVSLGQVNGKDGAPGKDGVDGLGFDDLDVVHDGERGFTFAFRRGEQIKEFMFVVPAMIYRGIFKEGRDYQQGDVVTWGGSAWHCSEATGDKPGDGAKGWTLAVKEGRKGKDGKDGAPGEQGKTGVPGRDGRTWQ